MMSGHKGMVLHLDIKASKGNSRSNISDEKKNGNYQRVRVGLVGGTELNTGHSGAEAGRFEMH